MIAVTGKKLSQIYKDIEEECGQIFMEERDYRFTQEKKDEMTRILMVEKQIPQLPFEIEKLSHMDGSKVYFKNGGWVVARFSGTEPLLRIFCEMPDAEQAKTVSEIYEDFLGL
jgi:phosphomannomutase